MTSNPHPTISSYQAWLLAIRPKTLPAAVGPVLVGTACAVVDGGFAPGAALAALVGALMLQIGVNLANDYFDGLQGVDTTERLGPLRVTQSGLIAPDRVRLGMIVVFAASIVVGFYLIRVGGLPILLVGLGAIAAALAYSGGPYPLASNGLGDLCVFCFYGPVAVVGTYFVQAHAAPAAVWLAALPIGMLVTAVLVVNNLRDIPTDRKVGKRTLAVRLGPRRTKWEYHLLVVGAFVVTVSWGALVRERVGLLLCLLVWPRAWRLLRRLWITPGGRELNALLADTALLGLLFSLCFAAGLLVPRVAGWG